MCCLNHWALVLYLYKTYIKYSKRNKQMKLNITPPPGSFYMELGCGDFWNTSLAFIRVWELMWHLSAWYLAWCTAQFKYIKLNSGILSDSSHPVALSVTFISDIFFLKVKLIKHPEYTYEFDNFHLMKCRYHFNTYFTQYCHVSQIKPTITTPKEVKTTGNWLAGNKTFSILHQVLHN